MQIRTNLLPEVPRGMFSVLRENFRDYRVHLWVLGGVAIFSAILDALSINAIVPLLSFLIGEGNPTDVVSKTIQGLFALIGIEYKFRYLLIFVMLLIFSRAIALACFTLIRTRISTSFFAREIGTLLRGTLDTSWGFVVGQKAGHLQNTIFWDAKRTTQLLDSVVQFLQSSTGAVIYLVVAVNISPLVTLITLGVGTTLLLTLRPLIMRARVLGRQTAQAEKTFSHRIGEYMQGFKSIKASATVEKVAHASQEEITLLRDTAQRASVVKLLSSVFIQPASFVFVMVLFAISYTSASFNLASFAATIYLVQKIFVYLESTQGAFFSIVEFVPFAENVVSFKKELAMHREEDRRDGDAFSFNEAIEFSNVSLAYMGADRKALAGVSLRIPRGSMIGIVGPSGSGKTSIADVLLRLFEPSSGKLLIDGRPANTVGLSQWRSAVSYVSQDAFLMHASIRDNIRFFNNNVSDADIERAAQQAHVHDVIMRLPEGFDTVLGDRGATLSGGERQRLAIARALARSPQVLVLDEVTSTLDSELEQQITSVIAGLRGSVTLVVIAHRISTVVDADEIVVIEEGCIKEHAPAQAMLADPESYLSRMRALQAGHKA